MMIDIFLKCPSEYIVPTGLFYLGGIWATDILSLTGL